MACQKYVDDFWFTGNRAKNRLGMDSFVQLVGMTGFKLDLQDKTHYPEKESELLGLMLEVTETAIAAKIKPGRLQDITADIKAILLADELTTGSASKLAGELMFASTSFLGKIGRVYMRPPWSRAASTGNNPQLSVELRQAMQWWLVTLPTIPPRQVPLRARSREGITIYADGMLEPGANDVGAVIIYPPSMTKRPQYFKYSIPDEVLQQLEPRETQIAPIEMIGVIVALCTWRDDIQDTAVNVFCDSKNAVDILLKGYSSKNDLTDLAARFWSDLAELGTAPWLARVATKLNLADGPSRSDFKEVRQLLAIPVTPQIPDWLLNFRSLQYVSHPPSISPVKQ